MAYDFEQLKKDVAHTGREVGAKAKELSETARLQMDIQSKRRELNKLYSALGQVYFTAHQKDEDIPEAVMFNGIRRAEAELATLKQQLNDTRKKPETEAKENTPEDTPAESEPEDAPAESEPEDAPAESEPEDAPAESEPEDAPAESEPEDTQTES